mmetsp:Transcript_17324/g.41631  ORF Transcript_17324/g.41631 Transcript_17324/m.41631 type:complete len:87 (-) Transcript_17324:427-687(-)
MLEKRIHGVSLSRVRGANAFNVSSPTHRSLSMVIIELNYYSTDLSRLISNPSANVQPAEYPSVCVRRHKNHTDLSVCPSIARAFLL